MEFASESTLVQVHPARHSVQCGCSLIKFRCNLPANGCYFTLPASSLILYLLVPERLLYQGPA